MRSGWEPLREQRIGHEREQAGAIFGDDAQLRALRPPPQLRVDEAPLATRDDGGGSAVSPELYRCS